MMHFRNARLKLTIFYVLIAMSISIIFSIALYNISSTELEKGLAHQTGALRGVQLNGISISYLPNFDQMKLDQMKESNNHLQLNLIYFNLLVLILASVAGYLLAKKTLDPIEKAMDSQNSFTADASHELRTPLTAMKTEIEVNLRDKKFDLPDAKKLLKSNLEEIEKLESLSNALLKLARSGGESKVTLDKVSLEDVIVEAYEKVESLTSKKQIKINCHPELGSGNDRLFVKGDKNSMVELFVILFDNAIKYSPAKSKVSIKIKKEKNQAIISISDHGIGIKASDIPFIFNRFYRADISRSKEKVDGYGLGLSIAKRIIDFHKGSISANSKPGKGSEFIVALKIYSSKRLITTD